VVTDQPEFVEEGYRKNDTVYFGAIIKTILENHFKLFKWPKKLADKVEIVRISENPTLLSLILKNLQNSLQKKLIQARQAGTEKLYLCITGGIPTLNAAIMLLGNSIFKLDMQLIRVNDNLAFPDPIANEFEKFEIDGLIKELGSNWSFKHIELRLARAGTHEPPYKQIKILCRSMSQRLVFDFEGATKTLTNGIVFAHKHFREAFEIMLKELNELKDLKNNSEARKFLIRELILNIKFKYKQREFVDVAGRLFRLLEELAIFILELIIEKNIRFSDNERNFPAFTGFVKENLPLKTHLENRDIDWQRLNIFTAKETISFCSKDERNKKHSNIIKSFLKIYNDLSEIKQLRNKSIIAHGFKSITERDFPDEFLSLLDKCGELVGIKEADKSISVLVNTITSPLS
jgi:hypothetical protein